MKTMNNVFRKNFFVCILLLVFLLWSGPAYSESKKEMRIIKREIQKNEIKLPKRIKADRIAFIPNIIRDKTDYYIVALKNTGMGPVHWALDVYTFSQDKEILKKIYHENIYIPMGIKPIPIGFMLMQHTGMGRKLKYTIYYVSEEKTIIAFSDCYDLVEFAYFPGYDQMPHLFCTEFSEFPVAGKDYSKIAAYTDVFEFDNKQRKYNKIKHIGYKKKGLFKDRFNIKKGLSPAFSPIIYHSK